ncbi:MULTISPECIES: PAS domain-containing protein [unclassified Marinovum]
MAGSRAADDGVSQIVPLNGKLRAKWGQPLQQVEAYWQAMRGNQTVPSRSKIDPRGIETALEFAFIAERAGTDRARLRIGGTHMCDLMGMEVRGMPLSAMLAPLSRDRLAHALLEVFDAPARAEMTLVAEKRPGTQDLAGRLLLLPLMDDFGAINRVLGCLVSDGPVGVAPRRFDVLHCDITDLRARPKPSVATAPRHKVVGQAEPQPSHRASAVSYLRLVEPAD